MKELKQYGNVFANMLEHHNKIIVPLLKSLGLGSIKVNNRRIITLQKTLETQEKLVLSINVFAEYLITNYIILSLVDQSQLESSYELIRTRDKENMFIGINAIYHLVEEKRKELYAGLVTL